ncbi:MAG TPA: TIGR02186 family protein [Hyphomicrobiales bacterium]|nr:TIGR02186 family protein [Hyphomicrobiales bacterium]
MRQAASKFLRLVIFVSLCFAGIIHERALAQDETVQLDTSLREISIGSDFRGADIVIFGAVDDSKQKDAEASYYDIIVVIRGPSETVIARRKENHLGIWINAESRSFEKVPSFYGVLSTKPLDEIVDPAILRRLYIELDPTPFEKEPLASDPFEEALVRLKTKQGLYVQNPEGVKFLSKSLFRASLELPTSVTEGDYSVRIYLFHDRELLSWDKSIVEVKKAGIERYLYTLAFDQPYAYGLLAVTLAVFSGLIGWAIFGRS